ncbi:hypothetical protein CC78DRAFT_621150 [Lojkania enalia]|uniref:FAD-binding domain-containing protein n=1 Tax=Lojkania enalia TaxID=147567 RepID=A0A9P4JYN6_9PLEO|nr:hypothetical protein CC78DRAFT_621150 [Didymosphaeria enalia]
MGPVVAMFSGWRNPWLGDNGGAMIYSTVTSRNTDELIRCGAPDTASCSSGVKPCSEGQEAWFIYGTPLASGSMREGCCERPRRPRSLIRLGSSLNRTKHVETSGASKSEVQQLSYTTSPRCFNAPYADIFPPKTAITSTHYPAAIAPSAQTSTSKTGQRYCFNLPKCVTMLDDAAHLMTPFAGIGVNIAFYDAMLLVDAVAKFVKSHRADDLNSHIIKYEKEMWMLAKEC